MCGSARGDLSAYLAGVPGLANFLLLFVSLER